MKPAKKIKNLFSKSKVKVSSEFDERIVNDALTMFEKSKESKSAEFQPSIWRIIMRNSITKSAIAAVLVIAAMLTITFLNKSATPAYALEQTLQAGHNIRYLHIKSFMVSISDDPIECWVEFSPDGEVKNMRLHKPAWMDPDDGNSIIVWKDNKIQLWVKRKNFLVTMKDKEIATQILSLIEQSAPKNAVENILKAQEQGDAKVEINEPQNKANPTVITADFLKKSDLPFQRVILFVDQATKLLNSVETYQLKDGQYIHFSTIEFYDYDMPIDPKMFVLEDEVPADVMRMDQTTREIGLAQGQLSDKEIAVKLIRQFLEALIKQDYAEAGRLFGGVPAERMKKAYGQIKFIRIISIGEPTPRPAMKALYVPCTVEIEENGKISQWTPEHSYVRQVHGQPERWEIIGGFRGI